MAPSRPKVVVCHGEDRARQALAAKLAERHGIECAIPGLGDTITL